MTDETTIDRPGELLKAAVEIAREDLRVEAGIFTDPRDSTEAPVYVDATGVHPVPECIFDDYRAKPVRRTGTAKHTRLPSFIAHVNRFKGENSAIFADDNMVAPRLTAVIDYHAAGYISDASFAAHRSVYPFPLSPEWKAWFGKDGTAMSMTDFALFLEDHIVDVLAEPGSLSAEADNFVKTTGGKFASPSKLIEIARGLQVNEQSVVKETRNLTSGEAEIVFDAQHVGADGKPLKLPNMFVIAIPVFAMSDVVYRLIARLRYRKRPDGLAFWFELWRPDLVFTDAFEESVRHVEAETKLPVFIGAPEAI